MENTNQCLDDDVRKNVERLTKNVCEEWGGKWVNGKATVVKYIDEVNHCTKTEISDRESALDAFNKYTEFTEYVINEREATSNSVVIVPCGSTKPVGASANHRKKLTALNNAGFTSDCDIAIMSEPCSIFPHDMRLSLAATNYDFPPEYTEKSTYPEVFEIMSQRIASWIDERDYNTIYAYLFKRHQSKLIRALEIAKSNPIVVNIPGASYNPESDNYSGDQFKSTENITHKLDIVRSIATEHPLETDIAEKTASYYINKENTYTID